MLLLDLAPDHRGVVRSGPVRRRLRGVGLVEIHGDPSTARWLIEVPHGADEPRHYRLLESLLRSPLPDDLIAFFQVNTDVGSWALGQALVRALEARGEPVCAIRCGIPRTFVDVNRVLSDHEQGFTPGLQPWITDPADKMLLTSLHVAYTSVVRAAYHGICGRGGRALNVRSCGAPGSVRGRDRTG